MATDVKLPELGEGVSEGELLKWLVKPGDAVKTDQAIAEIMTDKATVEVPSLMNGVVKELKYKVGEIIKVESVMITLDTGAGSTAAPSASKPAAAPVSQVTTPAATASAKATAATGGTLSVKLPELGEGVSEGELIKWLVKPGDTVKVDQSVAEIMTDKATVEVPSTVAGTVSELMFKVGEVIKVENIILKLSGSATATTVTTSAPVVQAAAVVAPTTAKMPAAGATQAGPILYPPPADFKVLATPSTRRLAREMGVDLNGVPGSGLAGRVTRDDVMSAKGPKTSAPQAANTSAPASFPKSAYVLPSGVQEEREIGRAHV